MNEKRKHPLSKERFFEGVRQKWCAVFCAIGLAILVMTALGDLKDPAPFLTFFTGIGVCFILGASGSDIMKSYRVETTSLKELDEINKNETVTVNKNETVSVNIIKKYEEQYAADPSYRPINPDETNMEIFR